MPSLFDVIDKPGAPAQAQTALSITELTQKIRGTLEPAFAQVWVQGEISNFRPAPSGHLYFSLKDSNAQISAALFGWGARNKARAGSAGAGPAVDLREGLQVLCRGKVTVYPPRGSYQLTVDQIEPLGAGALQVAFEQLKARLAAEGLFDAARKRTLPRLPLRIAVVTSPTGAAIQDMINVLRRRARGLQVIVIPALVQGPEAPAQIKRGLEVVNRLGLADVVILARGGGSLEDLWAFNDEALVRAVVASRIPVISGVGHEIDFTLCDFAADLRAPTPSAAAEIVSSGWNDAQVQVLEWTQRLRQAVVRDLITRKTLLAHVAARLVSPKDRLREQMQRLDDWSLRLQQSWARGLEVRRAGLSQAVSQLHALSPLRVLERGYVLAREAGADGTNGVVIKSRAQVHSGSEIILTFHDGETRVRAMDSASGP